MNIEDTYNSGTNEPIDIEIKRKLADLEWEIQPSRDLWQDISSKIRFADRKLRSKQKPAWMPIAMAASVVLATVSLVFSSMTYQRAQDADRYQAALVMYQQAQLGLIEQQHQMVRVQFSQLLQNGRDTLNPAFVVEAETLMMNIDAASGEIKKAISVQPFNPEYTSMLVRTYQQELKLLNKVNSKQGISI